MPTLVTPATMLRMAFASPCLFALCGLIGACVPQAKADAIADFYRARTVTVVVTSVADLKTHEVTVGVSGANSTPAFFTRLLNATLGTKMKPINGYPGQNDVLLAMERRELNGHPSAFFSSVRTTRPRWLREKTAKAIWQYGPQKLAELRDVPFAPDLVASDDDRLVMQAAFAPLALGRPFVVPPGVP